MSVASHGWVTIRVLATIFPHTLLTLYICVHKYSVFAIDEIDLYLLKLLTNIMYSCLFYVEYTLFCIFISFWPFKLCIRA